MLDEPSDHIDTVVVAVRSRTREFADALGDEEAVTVEVVDDTATVRSRLDGGEVDCVLTDHDPPAVDAAAVLGTAVEAGCPSLLVTPDPYESLDLDPFEAGAGDVHEVRGERGRPGLARRRLRRIVRDHRESVRTRAMNDALLADSNQAIGFVDLDGTLRYVNERALYFVGDTSMDPHLDVPIWDSDWTTRSNLRESKVKAVFERVRAGETVHMDTVARDHNHNLIEVENVFRPVTVGDRTIGMLVCGRDVTEPRSVNRRLHVLTRVLRHNLRNDLTAINGHAEVLAESVGTDASDHAEAILRATENLIDKSELARRVEEAMSVDRDPVGTTEIVRVLGDVLSTVRERNPAVTIDTDLPASRPVRAEETIGVAFRVLFDNAIEHNDAAEPRLAVTVESVDQPASDDPGTLVEDPVAVRITDNGPGIPDHEIAVIEAGEETALEHGSGLGLWVANWVVTDSGGTLTFETTADGGSEVVVTLPAATEE